MAQKIQTYWPKPNLPGLPDGTNNFSTATPDPNLYQNHIIRIDHELSDKQKVYGHLTKYYKTEGPYRDYFQNDATGQFAIIQPVNVAFDDTYIFGPRLVMDLRYGFQRYPISGPPKSTGFDLSKLGFPQALLNQLAYRNPLAVTFPRIDVTGVQTLQGENPSFTGDDIHSFFADFNQPIGNHSLKFGVEVRVFRKNVYAIPTELRITDLPPPLPMAPWIIAPASPGGMGQAYAALLLGQHQRRRSSSTTVTPSSRPNMARMFRTSGVSARN